MNGQTSRRETTEQMVRLNTARAGLADELRAVEQAAKAARRILGRTRQPDLTEFFGSVNAVRRAEEALDFAHLDLRTASGEDA